MDYTVIGSSPVNEPCAQVGCDDYPQRARRECRALIGQLIRIFGEPPPGAQLGIKSFPHDFGTYCEVVCLFDPSDLDAMDYAYRCEDGLPDRWDEEARTELAGMPEATSPQRR